MFHSLLVSTNMHSPDVLLGVFVRIVDLSTAPDRFADLLCSLAFREILAIIDIGISIIIFVSSVVILIFLVFLFIEVFSDSSLTSCRSAII